MLRAVTILGLLAASSCAALPDGDTNAVPPAEVVIDPAGSIRPQVEVALPDSLAVDFTQLQPELPGQVGLAVMPVFGDRMTVFGDWTSGIAWSTMKVPLTIAALRHDSGPAMTELAESAITVSDNWAAEALWESLGDSHAAAHAVQDVIDEAGNDVVASAPRTELDFRSFGGTEWSLTNQLRFASRLPCLPDSDRVLPLMSSITPDQRWGLGVLPGSAFKGGWGPDDETGIYTVRQLGLVPTASGLLAVTLAAQADSGSFDDSTAILTRMAEMLGGHLDELPGGGCPPPVLPIAPPAPAPPLPPLAAPQPGTTSPDS
ncbi:serine hydrolase [Nocardia callitridis]|uniref:Serine hydrolase n=1 Tax=Nocardia callitridis TaxID=648753 RepID=A0ABP9KRE1_9NOCA